MTKYSIKIYISLYFKPSFNPTKIIENYNVILQLNEYSD